MDKRAATDCDIHELLARRWSPYAFADAEVSDADLRSLFEAARWAPSSYNEQPWSYLVARRSEAEEFQTLLSCLVEANREWARAAAVLALGITRTTFSRNDRPNRAAEHDLGLASASLVLEATARGLIVHQMIGILPDRAREVYGIPAHSCALTALAIGSLGDPGALPDGLRERDLAARSRKRACEFVFSGSWGKPSQLGAKA